MDCSKKNREKEFSIMHIIIQNAQKLYLWELTGLPLEL